MKTSTVLWIVGMMALAATLAACAGFDLGDIVHSRTPVEIQRERGLPAKMSVNESEEQYQAWLADTTRVGTTWKTNIDRGREVQGVLGQLTLSAWDQLGPTIAGMPIAAPLLPAASGLLGLFLGARKLSNEKRSSYNKGLQVGADTASKAKGPPQA